MSEEYLVPQGGEWPSEDDIIDGPPGSKGGCIYSSAVKGRTPDAVVIRRQNATLHCAFDGVSCWYVIEWNTDERLFDAKWVEPDDVLDWTPDGYVSRAT